MIIPDSFLDIYNTEKLRWEPIKTEVDGLFRKILLKHSSALYNSRIKGVESAFVKAQKGDYEFPFNEMEDFFACQVIVPSKEYLQTIISDVEAEFDIESKPTRPLAPSSFDYNETHLILKLKDSPYRQNKTDLRMVFELQIKTFLQSALQQASHDLTYKPQKISYWTERVVGQLRAILELADDVLAQVEITAQTLHARSEYEDNNYKTDQRKLLQTIETNFPAEQLPQDRRRIAVIVKGYLDMAGVSTADFDGILKKSQKDYPKIFEFISLTIPDKIFIVLFYHYRERIIQKFNSGKVKVLITREMVEFFPELNALNDNGKVKLNIPTS